MCRDRRRADQPDPVSHEPRATGLRHPPQAARTRRGDAAGPLPLLLLADASAASGRAWRACSPPRRSDCAPKQTRAVPRPDRGRRDVAAPARRGTLDPACPRCGTGSGAHGYSRPEPWRTSSGRAQHRLGTACAPRPHRGASGRPHPGAGSPEGGPAAQASGPGMAATAFAPLVDRGIGALPWAGVHRGGRMGTPECYDHIAERATAMSYGQSTPFGPPGTPAAFPASPTPYPY